MPSPLPVIVISGGLGSGKTTLVNHLLHTGVGRVGVVVNDFGDINVDAFLVTGHVDATTTITGGCLCCIADPDELDRALAELAAPALDLDVVLVEASGLAEPRELARMVLGSQVSAVRFGGVVQLVDAAAWAEDPQRALPVAADHLRVASLLVVNKDDRVDASDLDALTALLTRAAPDVPIVRTRFGRVDPTLLFDAAERDEPIGQLSLVDLLRDAEPHHHEHDHVSVSLESDQPVDPARLVAFLENRPAGVYRVKGETYVDTPGRRHRYVVQAVGGWVSFERGSWPIGQDPATRLVAIGAAVDRDALRAALEECLSEEGPLPADRLHVMTRYVRA